MTLSPTSSRGNTGTAVLDSVSLVIGNAAIKALPTTTQIILPFTSASVIRVPVTATFHLLWTADYTNIGSTASLGIEYGTEGASSLIPFREASQGDASALLAPGASHVAVMPQLVTIEGAADVAGAKGSILADADAVGSSLRLYAVNSGTHTGDFTGGDAANFLTVTVVYTTFTV